METVVCPVCQARLQVPPYECVNAVNHLIQCGAILEISSGKDNCLCGVPFVDTHNNTTTYIDDYIAHIKNVPHDWPKLLTRSAMEQF